MAELSREEVETIAHLARLDLGEGEIESLRGELGAILDHIKVLQDLDTEGVEPMTHAVPMTLRLREDAVEPSLPAETAVAGAPDVDDDPDTGGFRVPDILEGS